jgi:transcriptional regulator with XRE-family HTH domain/quercetin dioxygenase-like cupin family protein
VARDDTSAALGGVGARMRELREQRHMSLRELARRINVTPSLISQIETGKINPSVSSLYAVANALDVPMDSFFSTTEGTAEPSRRQPVSMSEVRISGGAAATTPQEEQASRATGPRTAGMSPVLHHDERERIYIDGFGGTLVWERLTRTQEPMVDFLEIRYEPGASSAQNLIIHSGREYGVVLEGELTVELAFERYTLMPGDSVAYDSGTPHRLTNAGSVPVRALWVVVDRELQPGDGSHE